MDQVTILKPRKGWQAINFADLWEYRELMFTLAGRDIRVRYKQTVLGVAWVILQPLMAAGIFTFVFGKVAKMDSGGVPYFAFSYSGMMCWNLFLGTLSKASSSLVSNTGLISKIYFPRMILPLSGIPSTFLDFSVALILMAAVMIWYGIIPGLALLLLPVWLLILVLLGVGIGLWAGSLAVKYRDVNYIIPVATQMLLYISPIAYSASAVPAQYQTPFYLNPIAGLMDAIRWSILGTGPIQWWPVAYSAIIAVFVFIMGALVFRKMEREFSDVI